MDLFATALGDMLADPHVGVDAVWRRGGADPAAPVRVASAFDTAVIHATDLLTVAVMDVPDLTPGDTLTLGPDTLVVQHAERDASGVAWRVFCRR